MNALLRAHSVRRQSSPKLLLTTLTSSLLLHGAVLTLGSWIPPDESPVTTPRSAGSPTEVTVVHGCGARIPDELDLDAVRRAGSGTARPPTGTPKTGHPRREQRTNHAQAPDLDEHRPRADEAPSHDPRDEIEDFKHLEGEDYSTECIPEEEPPTPHLQAGPPTVPLQEVGPNGVIRSQQPKKRIHPRVRLLDVKTRTRSDAVQWAVKRELKRRLAAIRSCYEYVLKRDPSFRGKAKLRFRLEPVLDDRKRSPGPDKRTTPVRVVDFKVRSTTLQNPAFERCLTHRMRHVRVLGAELPAPVRVQATLSFDTE